MKTLRKSFPHHAIVTAALFACGCFLFSTLSPAQSYPIDNCSSAVVDSQEGVEQTVCIYGDASTLTASAEVDANVPGYPDDYDTWAAGVGLDTQLYEGNTLEWDSSDQQNIDGSYSQVTEEDSFTPDSGATYSLNTTYDEFICETGDSLCPYDYPGGWGDVGWYTGIQGLGTSATALTGIQGYVNPKFIVLGVTYAPPGPSSNTWVQYLNSTYVGSTESLFQSITSGYTYSVSLSSGGSIIPGVLNGKVTSNHSTTNSQTTTNSSSVTTSIQVQSGEKTYGTGNYFAPVDYDYDTIWVWLNPAVIFTVGPSTAVWNGYGYDENDQNGMDIVGIALGYLNGDFGSMPPQFQTSLNRSWAANQIWPSGQGPALTSADLAQIASADPFSASAYGPDQLGYNPPIPSTADNRFTLTECNGGNSFDYLQADPSTSPAVFTCSLTYTDLTTQARGISTVYSQTYSVDESFSGSGFLSGFDYSVGHSTTLSWTTQAQASITNSTSSTASASVQGPPCNNVNQGQGPCVPVYDSSGNQPTQFDIYQDNMFGTFMFAPVHYF